MKNMIISAISLLSAALLSIGIPTEAEAQIYDDTVRLHILADSDGKEDQMLKLCVRDKILSDFGTELADAANTEDALVRITSLLPDIENAAREELASQGSHAPVSASVSTEWYDTRDYGDFSLPAGFYSSLRVIIGSGEGQNWWCVMYPPLCTELASERAPADDGLIGYTDAEIALISGERYNVKFKMLEIVSRAFYKKG